MTKNYSNHELDSDNQNPLLRKHPFRMFISGPSNCGKTNLLLNLIFDFVEWDRLYICAKDLEEDSYSTLIQNFDCFKDITEDDIIKYKTSKKNKHLLLEEFKIYSKESTICNNLDDFIDVDDLDIYYRILVVFDDLIIEKNQKKITEFFIRGRKKNTSIIYLAQKYYGVPKTIRVNYNYLIFFKIDLRDLNRIIKEIDGYKLNANVLKEYEYYVLDKIQKEKYMRYRINFNPFLEKEV